MVMGSESHGLCEMTTIPLPSSIVPAIFVCETTQPNVQTTIVYIITWIALYWPPAFIYSPEMENPKSVPILAREAKRFIWLLECQQMARDGWYPTEIKSMKTDEPRYRPWPFMFCLVSSLVHFFFVVSNNITIVYEMGNYRVYASVPDWIELYVKKSIGPGFVALGTILFRTFDNLDTNPLILDWMEPNWWRIMVIRRD